jgi:dATP pyrophosphohydrolase
MSVTSSLIEAHIFRQKENTIEFLLLKRAPGEIYPGLWQMVTGHMNYNDEKLFQTAIREIKEETGLIPEKFWVVPNVNSFYSPETNEISMIPVFAALVNQNAQVTISEEHSEYKWVSMEDAVELLAWEGQKKSVDSIYEYFMLKQNFLKFIEIEL